MRLARVNQAKNHPGRKLSEPGETTIPRDHSQDPCYWLASGASSFARAAAVVVLLLVGVLVETPELPVTPADTEKFLMPADNQFNIFYLNIFLFLDKNVTFDLFACILCNELYYIGFKS